MKHYLLPDDTILSFPESIVNFEENHPVHEAQELDEAGYLELIEARKPKPQPETWKEAREREYEKIIPKFIEAYVDKELGKPETMTAYLADVAAIKQAHPKE